MYRFSRATKKTKRPPEIRPLTKLVTRAVPRGLISRRHARKSGSGGNVEYRKEARRHRQRDSWQDRVIGWRPLAQVALFFAACGSCVIERSRPLAPNRNIRVKRVGCSQLSTADIRRMLASARSQRRRDPDLPRRCEMWN